MNSYERVLKQADRAAQFREAHVAVQVRDHYKRHPELTTGIDPAARERDGWWRDPRFFLDEEEAVWAKAAGLRWVLSWTYRYGSIEFEAIFNLVQACLNADALYEAYIAMLSAERFGEITAPLDEDIDLAQVFVEAAQAARAWAVV